MTLTVSGSIGKGSYSMAVDFSAMAGEVVGVVGRNGVGKTTLIETIAGIIPMVSGSISLNEVVWDDASHKRWVTPETRHCAVVFQDLRLFPHMSVLQNVMFGLRARGASRSDARATAREQLVAVGAAHLAERKASALSGGEAQRVALARAIANKPSVLLLDEPLSAIDAVSKEPLRGVLANVLSAYEGVTLLVTHDSEDVASLASRSIQLGS